VQLAFSYVPTADMPAALTFYRDTLGFSEAWREGTQTVAFEIPGTDVQLMVDHVADAGRPGPVFLVDSLLDYHRQHADDLTWVEAPAEIPGGYWGVAADPAGNPIYVMDQSTADQLAPS
jgi:catechol 2,3-dioxygenase-like lactoylglutathione lyase family enzyme